MTFRFTAALLPLILCGCVTEPVGDFGRRDESVFHDTILAGAGDYAARGRGEASSFPMTDEENELRNVAWDLVRPPGGGGRWNSDYNFTMQWSRIEPRSWYDERANDFYLLLRNEGVVSHETLYQRIIEQARGDGSKLPLFRDVATRVGKADAARRGALKALYADELMRNEAEARIAENGRIVAWVEDSLQYRIRSYRTALGRLMVEVPSTKAVEAEAAIDALQWEVQGSIGSAGTSVYKSPVMKKPGSFRPVSKRRVTKD